MWKGEGNKALPFLSPTEEKGSRQRKRPFRRGKRQKENRDVSGCARKKKKTLIASRSLFRSRRRRGKEKKRRGTTQAERTSHLPSLGGKGGTQNICSRGKKKKGGRGENSRSTRSPKKREGTNLASEEKGESQKGLEPNLSREDFNLRGGCSWKKNSLVLRKRGTRSCGGSRRKKGSDNQIPTARIRKETLFSEKRTQVSCVGPLGKRGSLRPPVPPVEKKKKGVNAINSRPW